MSAETLFRNKVYETAAPPAVSILVPTFEDDAAALISGLSEQTGLESVELIICDDGSTDSALTERLQAAIAAFPASATLITCHINQGRSAARNRLLTEARGDWILLVDADMHPDHSSFIRTYRDAIDALDPGQAAAICGGFSLKSASMTAATKLHAAQSTSSECLTAHERNQAPGLYIFTSNILVHRVIFETIPFDDSFTGWGWEDVDWGIRIAAAFPVIHIDNTATHLGLDNDDALLSKYKRGADNFLKLMSKHPSATKGMAIARHVTRLRRWPGLTTFAGIARLVALRRWLPMSARLLALKAYRVFTYSRAAAK